MFAMNIESAPSSAQLDEAQSLVNTNIDTSQVDGLLGAVGQQGALDGVKGQLAGLQGQAGGQLAQVFISYSFYPSHLDIYFTSLHFTPRCYQTKHFTNE